MKNIVGDVIHKDDWHPLGCKCKHEKPWHLADKSSASGGCIYWCKECGAISISSGRDEFNWKVPNNAKRKSD